MKKENLSYEEAMARLEELVRRIEANETGIDRLAGELKEAQRLVAFCREKLYATDEEIKKILETGEKRRHSIESAIWYLRCLHDCIGNGI